MSEFSRVVFTSVNLVLLMLLSTGVAVAAEARLEVARVFGDNMVLQRQLVLPVWGSGAPDTEVVVKIAGKMGSARSDTAGSWKVLLPALEAGGPYEMTVEMGGEGRTFHNVMIGEVWVSSGQSNMDFRLKNSTDGWNAIREANLPNIRYLRVEQAVSRTPRSDLKEASWEVCTPSSAAEFSAVAFYFAQALHREKGVPIGIINATWSGTPAEAWTSARMLSLHADFRAQMKAIERKGEDWEAGQRVTEEKEKLREQIAESGTAGVDHGVHRLEFDDKHWSNGTYPLQAVGMQLPEYSLVWARKSFDLPKEAVGKDLVLKLGKVYEWDQTYFNGEKIGSTRWDGERTYVVPGRFVKEGRNVIAIRLLSEWWAGQIGGPGDQPEIVLGDRGTRVSLLGSWKYDRGFEPVLPVGRYYKNEPSALFNGMIAPVIPFGIRGVLWYQGEGNAGNPKQYETLLPALILDWRARWGEGHFPFLVVQLPNIDGSIGRRWPELREAQAMATRHPKVGVVVTIDLGEPYNVHPANKKPVGQRLCLLARSLAYGQPGVSQGPIFSDAKLSGNSLRVSFTEIGSGLATVDGGAVRGFEIKGKFGDFVPADARIEGNSIVVSSSEVKKPIAVRYGWAPNPDCNLCNKEGLPARPFRSK